MRRAHRSYLAPPDPLGGSALRIMNVGRAAGGEYHRVCKGGSYGSIAFEYVTRGELDLSIDETSCRPRAGDLILLPYDRPSVLKDVPGVRWSKAWLVADGSALEALLASYDLAGVFHIPRFPLGGSFDRMLRLCARAKPGRGNAQRRLVMAFYEILIEAASLRRQREHPVSSDVLKVKGYLDSHLEAPISLDQVSELTHLSKTHLIRRFKREVGRSPYAYLLDRRMEHAKILLSTSSLRVKEIAARVGFGSVYHFSNMFKQKTGAAPSFYREDTSG